MSPLRTLFGSLAAPLLIHNQNQAAAMTRAAAAQGLGLDPATFGTPFPGSTITTTNNQTAGWLKGALLGAGLLAGGSAAGLGAAKALTQPAAVQTTPQPIPSAPGQAWDAITEEQQPDGSWKQIKRERLTP